jgi:glycosyltransferase involved in cell wall biosynthesis
MFNEKRKVLFFLPNLSGGGAEKISVTLLRQLDAQQYEITLVLVEKIGKYIELIPEHVRLVDLKAKKTVLSLFKLRKEIQRFKPDIVFSSLFRSNIILSMAVSMTKHKPRMILRSPNSPELLIQNKELGWKTKYLLGRAYKKADLVLAQTPQMREEIICHHQTDAAKVDVFLNPLDCQHIDEQTENISPPFDTKMINIVAAGRLSKQKGFDVLITAFALVCELRDDFILHILGEDGGEKEKLEQMIVALGLEKKVNLLGFQKNPYAFFYYSNLYVLSSRWEGLPNTVLENLYLRTPVVSTRCIPFMQTLIEDKVTGLLVDVDDVPALAAAILQYKTITPAPRRKTELKDINQIFNTVLYPMSQGTNI